MIHAADRIRNFYNIYVKTDRDKTTQLPLDPISQDPIPLEKQIKLILYDNEKPIKSQYFHLDTLDTWFKTRGEAINPLTNLVFTQNQIIKIVSIYKKNKLQPPRCIHMKKKESTLKDHSSIKEIYNSLKNPSRFAEFTNLLLQNSAHILSDQIKLDTKFTSPYYFLNKETLLMRCVLDDNLQALEELLYFNPDLDIIDERFGLKAIDLAMMSNKPLSTMILRTLLFHGANTKLPTKKGYLNELSNDIEKLSIVYEFE